MRLQMSDLSFYKGKRVLVTGHTGFKGSWIVKALCMAGASVTGYALDPPTEPSLFEMAGLDKDINSVKGDIRDFASLKKCFDDAQPEIVIHLAAQPLVRTSYKEPVYTYETNVMGTVNLLECVRLTDSVKSVVNVTTDKVYLNLERAEGYKEDEVLCGYDPYSNSKSCSELVTYSYNKSFFAERDIAVSTVRAGNVIGGGDYALDRIIPDCVRAAEKGEDIILRNPASIRPYEHVLEPVSAYLLIAMEQYKASLLEGSYNVGPLDSDCVTTGELAGLFCDAWNERTGDKIGVKHQGDNGPHEATFLKLDCTKIEKTFGWSRKWDIKTAIEKTVEWTVNVKNGADCGEEMEKTIKEYYKTDC